MKTLDMRKLVHFVAVAEELSFTRAAARLQMSQQALSTSIRQFEREVDVTLFERSPHHVVLTDAGQALLESARPLLAASGSAVERARRIGRGEPGVVRVGRTPAITGEEATTLMAPFRHSNLGIEVSVEQHWPSDLTRLLFAGEIDLALARVFDGGEGLITRTIASHPLRVALYEGHPLVAEGAVRLADLKDDTLVLWSRKSGYRRLLLDVCRRAGLEPREVVVNPVQGTPPVTAVTGPGEFALVTAPAGPSTAPGVTVLDIEPPAQVPVVAMWVTGSTSPLVEMFECPD
ncbi:MAG: LysR substrate-binding domain-containing protein [Solirubrobacterales bacterium]